jgi:hypothetical protein
LREDGRGRIRKQRSEHAASENAAWWQLAVMVITCPAVLAIENVVADRIAEPVEPNLGRTIGKRESDGERLQDKRTGDRDRGHPAQNPVFDAPHPSLFLMWITMGKRPG